MILLRCRYYYDITGYAAQHIDSAIRRAAIIHVYYEIHDIVAAITPALMITPATDIAAITLMPRHTLILITLFTPGWFSQQSQA